MRPARLAPALLLAVTAATAGCGLPEKARALVAPRSTPTVVPTTTPTPLPVPPLKMDFVRIREERVRGGAGKGLSEIDIALGGAERSEIVAARVVVAKAVDDLGTNLVPDDAEKAALAPLGAGDAGPVVLSVPLKVASRKATSLREVSGEIELYVPGADPSTPTATAAIVPRTPPPNTLRRYRFTLKDVPLP